MFQTLLGIIDAKFLAKKGLLKVAAISNTAVGILPFLLSVHASLNDNKNLEKFATCMSVSALIMSGIIFMLDPAKTIDAIAWAGITALFFLIGLGFNLLPYYLEG